MTLRDGITGPPDAEPEKPKGLKPGRISLVRLLAKLDLTGIEREMIPAFRQENQPEIDREIHK